MKGQIPQAFIEELLSRIDIKDIVGDRVRLRRAGANYLGSCPFHSEKTPSFTVSTTKQFYHCFGCGANGDAIKFLTEYEGLHFVEAVESLANRAGLTLPTETQESSVARYNSVYKILAEAAQFYQVQLRKHPLAPQVHTYLKNRGLTGEITKQCCLGFAPPGWDNLLNHLGSNSERVKDLTLAGLIVQKESNRYYDRLRNRLVFPIHDRRGRVVGFGGRVMDPKEEPKYLNSPETVVFSKGNELYGLYEARLGNRSLTQLVVVEGYMDVVSLAQFGINNAVASLGTALTDKQVDKLFQQASNLYFCFDGDKAGRQAAWKALQLILPQMKEGRRAHFILLPQGEDPDSFVQTHGKAAFVEKMGRAATLSDFLFEQLSANLDLQHLDARAQLVTLAKPLIQKIPTGVLQEMFYNRLAEIAQIDSGFIQGKKNNAVRTVSRLRNRRTLPPTAANRILALLLRDRSLIQLLNGIELESEDTKLLCAIIEVLQVEPKSSIELIQGCLPSELASQFSYEDLKAIADPIPEQGAEEEFLGALQTFRNRKQDAEVEKLLEIAKTRGLSLEEKSQLKLLLNKKHESSVD